jgi:N-acyl-D-aspartate/D-glutamate deacylase
VAEGLPIRGQVAPRPIGLVVGLQSSYHPFLLFPAWREVAGRPLAEQVQALHDPSFRERLLAEVPGDDGSGGRRSGRRRPIDFSMLFVMGEAPDYEPPPESSVASVAAARGVDPAVLTMDLLAANDGRNFLYTPFSNYADGNLDACGVMLGHPDTLFGLGDGGAHVGIIADASFPTYFLSHWARDRAHGRMPVGAVVQKLTSNNARAVGLADRGVVAQGMKADLNVIDFDNVRCEFPVMAYDLPAGGKRLVQGAQGYRATIVDGQVTYRDGEHTGALPGRLVRGGRDTAAA